MQFFTVEVKREVVDVKSIPAWENKHLPGKEAEGQEDRHVSRCLPCPLAMHRGPCGLHSESLADVSKMQIIFQYHIVDNAT